MTSSLFARTRTQAASFFVVAMLYAIVAVAIELAFGPRHRMVPLVGQYAVLLPCAVVALRRSRGLEPQVADIDRRVLIVAGVATALAVLAIAMFWDRGMLWGDESAYRVQAQMFAEGRPWTDAPTGISAHELRFNHLIVHDGHWFTKYPPLWPMVLAVGHALHARWLVNPLLAVLALWIIYRIARDELAVPTARFAVLVVLVSPYFFMMAASQMSHVLGLVCCAGAALCFLDGVRTQRISGLVAAIALIGACAFVRPFAAFCAAIAVTPWLFSKPARRMVPWLLPIAVLLGAVAIVALGLYNHLYTGKYTQSPYALYRGTALPVELSASPHVILGNLVRAARWAVQDTMFFTWPLLFALAAYAVWIDRSFHTRFLATLFVVFVAANLFHTEGSSSRFGDRYLFEVVFAPALLAARGAALVLRRFSVPARTMTTITVALTTVCALQGAASIRPTLLEISPYVQVHAAVDDLPADGSLVFFPITDAFTGDRFNLNESRWRNAAHMFLVDPGPDRRAAVAALLGRSRWIVLGYDRGPVVIASGRAP